MVLRPSILRASRLATQRIQPSLLRTTLQRRSIKMDPIKLEGPMDNAFNRERLAVQHHAAESAGLWRKLCIYVVIPALILASINAKNLWDEHWEHWDHMPPLEERTEYPYMNIRSKAFFFGDGDKTLFWNPKVNYHHKDE